MAIALTGAGSLFVKWGHIFGDLLDVLARNGAAASARVLSGAIITTRGAQIEADYAAGTAEYNVIDGLWQAIGALQSSSVGWINYLKTLASNTLIDMANTDTPLKTKDLPSAMALLISQMTINGNSVKSSVPSAGAQTAVGTPNGNPTIAVGVKDKAGVNLQYAFPETLTFKVTTDSQAGATLNQESVAMNGGNIIADPFNYAWPGGSGSSNSLSMVDATQSNTAGTMLVNGGFEAAVGGANYPDNWVKDVGTIGATILQAGTPYQGSSSLEFAGNGAELTSVYQPFNTASTNVSGTGGTPALITPLTQYVFNLYAKLSAASPAAGVLEIALTDAAGTIVNDAAGNQNKVLYDMTAVANTNWNAVNGYFRTPALNPTSVPYRLRVRLSTALTNTKNVFIDNIAFRAAQACYVGGPSASIFAGSTKVLTNDTWTIAITQTYGVFQKFLERLFSAQLRLAGLAIPSVTGGAETISDALVI